MGITEYIRLARPYQWYKNLVVFIALFFTGNLFNMQFFILTSLGFLSLCIISSCNYVINDIIDAKEDRLHPEKKNRPIAAGKIKKKTAFVYAILLLIIAIALALPLHVYFTLCAIAFFILTLIYSLKIKKEPFADIIFIGVNFVLRAVSGAFIINAMISPWLILCAFFLALFLAVLKRKSDIVFLGKLAKQHKPTLEHYKEIDTLVGISAALLIIAFALYSFLKTNKGLLFTLPFITYIIFRLIHVSGTAIGRHPHLALKDIRIMIAGFFIGIILFVVQYV